MTLCRRSAFARSSSGASTAVSTGEPPTVDRPIESNPDPRGYESFCHSRRRRSAVTARARNASTFSARRSTLSAKRPISAASETKAAPRRAPGDRRALRRSCSDRRKFRLVAAPFLSQRSAHNHARASVGGFRDRVVGESSSETISANRTPRTPRLPHFEPAFLESAQTAILRHPDVASSRVKQTRRHASTRGQAFPVGAMPSPYGFGVAEELGKLRKRF